MKAPEINKQLTLKAKAMEYARTKHKGQKDDDGLDYFEEHVKIFGMTLNTLTNNTEVVMAGFLHDILEDTEVTYEELKEEFGQRVADLVNEVTQEGTKDNYGYYFPRLKTAEGIMIKLVDRASNIGRMGSWNPERQEHYLNKTKFWKDGSHKDSPPPPTKKMMKRELRQMKELDKLAEEINNEKKDFLGKDK